MQDNKHDGGDDDSRTMEPTQAEAAVVAASTSPSSTIAAPHGTREDATAGNEDVAAAETTPSARTAVSSSTILRDEKNQIAYPKGKKSIVSKEANQDDKKDEAVPSTILRDEKSQIAYPKGKKSAIAKAANQDNKKDEMVPSTILRGEKSQIAYPKGKKTSVANEKVAAPKTTTDEPAPPQQQLQSSLLLREEKLNIRYPAGRRGGAKNKPAQQQADADVDPYRQRISDSRGQEAKNATNPLRLVESALVREEKQNIIYPACRQQDTTDARPHPPSAVVISTTSAAAAVETEEPHATQSQQHIPTEVSNQHHPPTRPEVMVVHGLGDLEEAITDSSVESHHGTNDQPAEEGHQIPGFSVDNENLARARLVVEPSHLNLPIASEVNTAQAEEDAAAKRCQTTKRTLFVFATGIVVFVGITLLVVFLLHVNKSKETVRAPENVTNISTTQEGNATIRMEDYIQNLLPGYTLDAIHDSEDTADSNPQYLAYQWSLKDTAANIGSNYSDWRIVQRFALATIYFATDGDAWVNNTHWLNHSVDECLWFSKQVYATYNETYQYLVQNNNSCHNGILLHLWLWQNDLQGYLPPELFLLTSLNSVALYSNQRLGGTLSTLIAQLTSLEALAVMSTELSGSIPTELGSLSNILTLNLLANQLTGPVPTELGTLSQLKYLLLDSNVRCIQWTQIVVLLWQNALTTLFLFLHKKFLTGSIPLEFGHLENLVWFYLFSNDITGTLPTELGLLTAMEDLLLYNNTLSGDIPSELGQLSSTTRLYLFSNVLTGSLPTELGLLAAMEVLELPMNLVEQCTIPSELGQLSSMTCSTSGQMC
jgi:hypothetical protein